MEFKKLNIELVKIIAIRSNPSNPRIIKDEKFHKLVKSIKDFPEMLSIRPIVVNNTMMVLGGNMRLRACKEAGLKEVYIIRADDLTEKQQREFTIKDNIGYGQWDLECLVDEWDQSELEEWEVAEEWEDTELELDFDNIESNENRETKDNTKEIACPECGCIIKI